jgi:hypothetical protein
MIIEGKNIVYMAAWYNGKDSKIFDISSYSYNPNSMLKEFWLDLINNNIGCSLYFHNWAGYDSILSLIPLLGLHVNVFSYIPIMHNGQLLSLTVFQTIKGKKKGILTIKDSLKMIPGALAKLAKDFQVETQKDHFPHYFLVEGNLAKSLRYEGSLPAYEYFEPKRTSPADYAEMVKEFKGKTWSFLEVSKQYILGDVKAQYQILVKYFTNLREAFPINPLENISVPRIAFTTWRTKQLPLLNKELLKVYDLSRTFDPKFREAYLGGIVDVYKPHLISQGYYYDVNSLYPTAMCNSMSVGIPTPILLKEFTPHFFGYLKVKVEAPGPDTPGGYIGLLPTKMNGRLICPGGIFSGVFFSEELRFALENGYKILDIGEAWSFQRGENTFKSLIEQLNEMKVTAQQQKRPVLRNIAKLLMNSMYGRFRMHTPELKFAIVNSNQLNILLKNYKILEVISLGELDLVSYALDQNLFNIRNILISWKCRR